MKHVVSRLLGLSVLVISVGCATTMVGVGPGAVPGTYVYLTGELQGTYNTPMLTLWPKALAAMQDLRLTVDIKLMDALGGEIEARRADGTSVRVRLKTVGDRSTILGVRVGFIGDREKAEYVHRAIQEQLRI